MTGETESNQESNAEYWKDLYDAHVIRALSI